MVTISSPRASTAGNTKAASGSTETSRTPTTTRRNNTLYAGGSIRGDAIAPNRRFQRSDVKRCNTSKQQASTTVMAAISLSINQLISTPAHLRLSRLAVYLGQGPGTLGRGQMTGRSLERARRGQAARQRRGGRLRVERGQHG